MAKGQKIIYILMLFLCELACFITSHFFMKNEILKIGGVLL